MALSRHQKELLENYLRVRIHLDQVHLQRLTSFLEADLEFADLFKFSVYAGAFIRMYAAYLSPEEAGHLFVHYLFANFQSMPAEAVAKTRLPSTFDLIRRAVEEELYRRKIVEKVNAYSAVM